MPGELQSPSEMKGTSYVGGVGGIGSIRRAWETTPLSLNLLQLLTLEGVAVSEKDGCLPGALSSLWIKTQCL